VRLVSRHGRDHPKRFHAIALTKLKPATLTLDGEVAVFATPPLFMVFDLLQLGEKDYRLEPLKVRRRALAGERQRGRP
jgi:ATP-dependent DNA ligase